MKRVRQFVFCAVAAFALSRAAASVTNEKPIPPVERSAHDEIVWLEYDPETGKPLRVVGFPGVSVPTAETIDGISQTNGMISVQLDSLMDFLEGLEDE